MGAGPVESGWPRIKGKGNMGYETYVSNDRFGVPSIYVRHGREAISRQMVKAVAQELQEKLNRDERYQEWANEMEENQAREREEDAVDLEQWGERQEVKWQERDAA